VAKATRGRLQHKDDVHVFSNFPTEIVHSGPLFILFCTVNFLVMKGLNIEIGG